MQVSIIIPTYKRTTYLKEALDSVIAQTFTDFECLVVNDYPPFKEELEFLIRSFRDKRIRLFHNPENGGESVSRNHAIKEAQGEIIALLDDDDRWAPEFLEQHVRMHHLNPQAGVVYCGYTKFWDDELLGKQVFRISNPPPENTYEAMLSGKFVLASSSIVSIKRECFKTCGVFDPSLPSFADWDMWVRIAEKYPFAKIESPLTFYRHHLGVRGSTNIDKRLIGIETISQKWNQSEGFNLFERKLRVRAYFNEIRNEVLRGNRLSSFRLLKECIRSCKAEIIPNYKVFIKAIIIVLLGKNYSHGHKMMYT